MKKLAGIGGAPGKALLAAAVLGKTDPAVEKRAVSDPGAELERFERARDAYIAHLGVIYQKTLEQLGEDSAKIFKAYEAIASDTLFFKKPLKAAREEGVNIDFAIEREKNRVCEKFLRMNDPYMQERASDIRNVCEAIVQRMNGLVPGGLPQSAQPFILVAEDLSPEDTIKVDKSLLGGFVTERGGVTSHAVILAKTLGIPAVVGAKGITGMVKTGQSLYINGDDGTCVIEPDALFAEEFEEEKKALDARKLHFEQMAAGPAVTKDGHAVSVCVNSGDADSIARFDAGICDGVGLFRTEFLFMEGTCYPDEETQLAVYRSIAEKAGQKEVIIRTLDIGGDKQLAYMDMPKEDNPFLGYRAIRLCLDRPAVFGTQLRAVLRASAHGNVKIMFPMIASLEELLQAKALLAQAGKTLREKGIAFNEAMEVGVMIETPAAALVADVLAKHVDFFSIGTNDLIQYVTATDRMNEKVQHLYSANNLSVLRAIKTVIGAGHAAGIRVGMCGEMASDPLFLPLLLGLGLDEFSVAPSQIGRLKASIAEMDMTACAGIARDVLALELADQRCARLAEAAHR